ncbi:hypothetical protein LOCUS_25330 [Klebsiella pneumoniae]|nr:hypothetical protein LOCUS_31550 [Klebsiella pneumoniae]GMW36607.1 hypothetical protein LOCUS_23490 [Klebsiella pneumoniae]GMW48578.1 hypothetical protein LOCUS_35560 [Klebsiella pneumoniae]GMW68277.1 hypothetical protein LOCUS_23200 [Klebsiella pneumoniae]GMW79388.1 hypothetical protein LOCUS_25330 [Klebsiella pneumoniae]
MSSYPAVYAEIYCLAKFIIYIYSFQAYARRGRRPTDPDRRASQPHRAAQRNEPLNNLNENKIILTSNFW